MSKRRSLSVSFFILLVVLGGCSSDNQEIDLTNGDGLPTPNPTPTLTRWDGACNVEVNELGYYDALNYRDAMICSVDSLEWPVYYKPDQNLIDTYVQLDPFWAETSYPKGHELFSLNTGLGICAWIMEWNDAYTDGDSVRARQALVYVNMYALEPENHISGYPETNQDKASQQSYRTIIQQAEVGDPSGLQQEITNACGYIPWPTPESGE